jgi:hypothetical protein
MCEIRHFLVRRNQPKFGVKNLGKVKLKVNRIATDRIKLIKNKPIKNVDSGIFNGRKPRLTTKKDSKNE